MDRSSLKPRLLGTSLITVLIASACGGASSGTAPPSGGPSAPAASVPASTGTPPGPTASGVAATPGATSSTPPDPASPAPSTDGGSPLPSHDATAATWTRLADGGGPEARSDHTWSVDDQGVYAYLFGGLAQTGALDDLWRLDLASGGWERLDPAGDRPAARFGHVGVWAPGVGLVVWSGQAGSTFFDDIWAFEPGAGSWRRLPDAGDRPAARYGSCGAIDAQGRLWVSHGFTDSGRFDDTRVYDFTSQSWSAVAMVGEVPIKRCLHDCLWSADGRFLLYAGQTNGEPALGDLWALDPATSTWSREPRAAPEPRQLYAVATVGGAAVVFGGADADRTKLDTSYLLDLTTLAWSPLDPTSERPSGRSGATLIADPARERLLLFGGIDDEATQDDLWEMRIGG